MTKEQTLKKALYNILKNDFALEFYTNNNFVEVFSFYHLSEVYNGLLKIYNDGDFHIDYQYHRKTKKLDSLLRSFVNACKGLKMEYIKNEVAYYKNLSKKIFDAKYTLDVELHTINQ